jgi:imidazolonepropionase-like amidohydrolase/Tol biopolymer transport system component
MKNFLKLSLFLCGFATSLLAQENQKWNIENPGTALKPLSFTTDEGTWMNLDVSPDGKHIIFDLLGDIYRIPFSGGSAELLAGGFAWEVQPRYSPDGKYISFTSDKNGGDNIWIMNSDGTGKKQVTKEDFRLLNNAVWTADSKYIIARKHYTGYRSLGAGELWMYHISGGLEGIQLTKRKNDQQDLGEPHTAPDGKSVYFSEDVSQGPYFQYNKDPNGDIYAIKKLHFNDGSIETVVGGPGGAVRPQISRDGKMLAFVKRVRLKSQLFVHNLETGEEHPVFDDLSRDQQEAWAIFGLYPNFNWTPDNHSLIFYAKGKIKKVDVQSLIVSDIPFQVNVKQNIADAVRFNQTVFTDDFDVKMVRQLATSPDGKMVAFNAVGYIYTKTLPSGKVERLTDGSDWEFEPSFSPDGKSIVYTTWNDELRGSIQKIDLKTKRITTISPERGFYYSPKFNNKGDQIVYVKGVGNDVLGYTYGKNPGIYMVSANGGQAKFITKRGVKPLFNEQDNRIYYQARENGKKTLSSCDLNGNHSKTHYTSTYTTDFIPSPDGKWLAFQELFNVYLVPLLQTVQNIDLSANQKAYPLKKLSKDAGSYVHWSKDSKAIHWTLGPKYYTREIKDAFDFVDEQGSKITKTDSIGLAIDLKLKTATPGGKIALKGARIITMKDNEVIENGTILIEKNKIIALGKESEVTIPADAKVYGVYGKTIIPGFIDVHAHLHTSPDGISPQQDWSYFANLAYGVTTAHDPSSNTEMVFSQAEMIKSGRLIGPRLYSTGTILYGADGDFKAVINNIDDARFHLKRMQAVGAFSVKSYNQPRREQRQQVLQAARELKMEVMPEGGSTFFHNMNMIADGHTGIEHNIPVVPIYKDVTAFWNASKTAYTPTLIVSYGSQSGENYWYDRTNVWENEKLAEFVPRSIIDPRSRRRNTSEYGDYGHIEVSKAVNQIAAGGTKVNLGAHGQLQGLGAHWELWMLAQGGMSPHDALKAATINGADYLGMSKEIGSLEKGKLADLIVLNENPLEDIRNTESIQYVMINGRLFEGETMRELGDNIQPRGKFWWQYSKTENYLIPDGEVQTWTFTVPECD